MLIYILKSAACLAILLLFYKLFLEKISMHVFKRFYLLGAILFAFVAPTVVFTEYIEVAPINYDNLNVSSISYSNTPLKETPEIVGFSTILWVAYSVGVLFFCIVFFKNLIHILKRIQRNPNYRESSFIHVLLHEKLPPHSFLKYIFLNKKKFEENTIPKEVLLHEETHAREKHSLDVLLIEVLQVIFWFNPLFYFYKKAIKLNHEFLADQAVLNTKIDTATYQNTLLSFLSSKDDRKQQSMLSSAINYSSIKKRFTIMKTKTSKKAILFRSLLLLPLLTAMLYGFSKKEIQVAKSTTVKQQKLKLQETATLEMVFNYNQLAKKYNAAPIKDRVIPIDDLKSLELIYGKMSQSQKQSAQPFPKCAQQDATKEEIQEYNTLAKKYNAMLEGDHFTIRMPDVERIKELYNLMTETQRTNAEPFPDFPKPPAMPAPPIPPNTVKEVASEIKNAHDTLSVQELVISEQFFQTDFPAAPNLAFRKSDKPLSNKVQKAINTFVKQKKKYHELIDKQLKTKKVDETKIETSYNKLLEAYDDYKVQAIEEGVFAQASPAFGKKIKLQSPKTPTKSPKPPTTKSLSDKAFAKKQIEAIVENQDPYDNVFMRIDSKTNKLSSNINSPNAPPKPQTPPKAKSYVNIPATPEQTTNLLREELKYNRTNGNIIAVETIGDEFYINIPPPPTPPNPLDLAIELAKKDATFYYKKKKISSDEAIEILKKNEDLSMQVSKAKNGKHIVKIDTHF
ncbi:M56 family metallopeptidase [Aurantibacter sp.]|uniref:M56 family metallopeptidase n=1 Tax=Aurantibacter sp. TaxID=2807103 RepID=UPI0032651CE4